MSELVTTSDYYDLHDILSRNAMWNFIMGARGLGKTYGTLKFCIKKYWARGWQFIYLRRTEEELKKIKPTFFADMEGEFPEDEFQVEGLALQMGHKVHDGDKKHDWHTIGYIVPLSTSGNLKSVPFPNVHYIVFDEIFPNTKHSYLSGEVNLFEEFYNTVDRYHDRTRLIALSNATSLANPYFSAFGIHMEQQRKTIQTYGDGYIAVEKADYRGFAESVASSKFGQFMIKNNPEYAEYAIDNKFRDATTDLISPLDTTRDSYNFTIETDEGHFSIWSSLNQDMSAHYVLSEQTPQHARWRTTVPTKVTNGKPFLGKRDEIMKRLQSAYRNGTLEFETAELKTIFLDLYGSTLA